MAAEQRTSESADAVTQAREPLGRMMTSTIIAGGAAGAASRTVVNPLERLKILMQVQPLPAPGQPRAYPNVWVGLAKMWREEGFTGLMRGNGVNCLRIAPYSAVQFATYEGLKRAFSHPVVRDYHGRGERHIEYELRTDVRLLAGAAAGAASVVSTYPLDLVRSRISIASARLHQHMPTGPVHVPGVVEMTRKVYREEGGIRGLYRGCTATSLGVAPYVAFNFFFYESARALVADREGHVPGPMAKLLCGAWAGTISQILTYPLDVIRRRMHVAGMPDSKLGHKDKGTWPTHG